MVSVPTGGRVTRLFWDSTTTPTAPSFPGPSVSSRSRKGFEKSGRTLVPSVVISVRSAFSAVRLMLQPWTPAPPPRLRRVQK